MATEAPGGGVSGVGGGEPGSGLAVGPGLAVASWVGVGAGSSAGGVTSAVATDPESRAMGVSCGAGTRPSVCALKHAETARQSTARARRSRAEAAMAWANWHSPGQGLLGYEARLAGEESPLIIYTGGVLPPRSIRRSNAIGTISSQGDR
jgi:hypothetical protein